MAEGFYSPNDLIMGFNFLVEKYKKEDPKEDEAKARTKAIENLVRCDIPKLEKAKEYSGTRFLPDIEVFLGIAVGGKIEYDYKHLRGLKFARASAAMGAMAHDHPKREGYTVTLGISGKAAAKNGQKLGEALRLLSEAGEVLLGNSVDVVKKIKPKANVTITIPYKTTAKDGKAIMEPYTNVKIKFAKANPKNQNVELTDKPEIPIKDATRKNEKGNDFLPLTVEGSVLNYGNIHKVLTRGSEISGSISFSACHSGLGLSISFTFTTLVVKSAGESNVTAAAVLGDDYADLLNDADVYDDDEDKPGKPESTPSTRVEVTTDSESALGAGMGDDDF